MLCFKSQGLWRSYIATPIDNLENETDVVKLFTLKKKYDSSSPNNHLGTLYTVSLITNQY